MNPETLTLVRRVCAAPGAGWAASSSGYAPLAAALHEQRYGEAEPTGVRDAWLRDLERCAPAAALLGVPYAGGSYGVSCSDSGPLGIRLALDALRPDPGDLADLGDVRFLPGPPTDDMLAPEWLARVKEARFGDASAPWPACMLSAAQAVAAACAAAGLPLITLGGDHSVSAAAMKGTGRRTGLLHVDAHGDLSTGRDGLSLLHSSWVHAADKAIGFAAVAQVGVADGSALPPWLAGRAIRIGAAEVARSPVAAAGQTTGFFARHGCDAVYVSIDIDALVRRDAPATGLPGGALPLSALAQFLDGLADAPGRPRYVAGDVTEVAPTLSGAAAAEWAREATCCSAAVIVARLVRLVAPVPGSAGAVDAEA